MSDFWSRRKEGVAREEKRTRAAEVEAAAAVDRAALEELPDEEALARLELPDPDTLAPGDDFARFLAREVPERIRRRALRALWRSSPVLANVDGLVDHGEDYTDAATVPSVLKTTYEVGRGLAAHVKRMGEALEDVAGDAEDEGPVPVTPPVAVVPPSTAATRGPRIEAAAMAGGPREDGGPQEDGGPDAASADAPEASRVAESHEPPAPRARMRFTFDTEETAA